MSVEHTLVISNPISEEVAPRIRVVRQSEIPLDQLLGRLGAVLSIHQSMRGCETEMVPPLMGAQHSQGTTPGSLISIVSTEIVGRGRTCMEALQDFCRKVNESFAGLTITLRNESGEETHPVSIRGLVIPPPSLSNEVD